jgi:hypothetical protein
MWSQAVQAMHAMIHIWDIKIRSRTLLFGLASWYDLPRLSLHHVPRQYPLLRTTQRLLSVNV